MSKNENEIPTNLIYAGAYRDKLKYLLVANGYQSASEVLL